MPRDRFTKGTGVYNCEECGKRTRDTGIGEAGVGLCATCYRAAEQANADSDDGPSSAAMPDTTSRPAGNAGSGFIWSQ